MRAWRTVNQAKPAFVFLLDSLGAGIHNPGTFSMKGEGTATHRAPTANTPEYEFHLPSKQTDYLISFAPVADPSPEEQRLTADIVILDHRARHQLRPKTREWDEVSKLLVNAVMFLFQRDAAEGRIILSEAEKIYYHHNQTRNRIRYLAGTVLGTVAAAVVAAASILLAKSLSQFIAPQLLILMFVFAGAGSLASVLTRISSLDLRKETSNFSVFVSGFSRPLVAIFMAVIVFLILDGKILDVHFGTPEAGKTSGVYLVTSFLCGFSERFAKDIVSRVPFAGKAASPEK